MAATEQDVVRSELRWAVMVGGFVATGQSLIRSVSDAAPTGRREDASSQKNACRSLHEVLRGFSYDLPIIVEIIDSDEKINTWLPTLEGLLGGGLVAVEKVRTLHKA